MAVRRRLPAFSSAGQPITSDLKDSDALPLPLYLTNGLFCTLFFTVAYFLLHRWSEKISSHTLLHVLTFSAIAAFFALVAFVIYLIGFFGIEFVQSFVSFIMDGSSPL